MQFGFRRLLTLWVTLLFFALTAIILAVSLWYSRDVVIRRAADQLKLQSEYKSNDVNHWLNDAADIALLISKNREMQDDLAALTSSPDDVLIKSRILSRVETISGAFSGVKFISMLDPVTGRVILSNNPAMIGRLRGNEEYFKLGRDALFVSSVAYSVGREEPVVHVSAPIHADGRLVSVVAVELNIADLNALIGAHPDVGEIGVSYLVDAYGFYVTTPPGFEGNSLRKTAESDGVRRALRGETGSGTYTDPLGRRVLGIYSWLPKAKMGLLVEIEESSITAEVNQVWIWIIAFAIFILFVALMSARYLGQRLVTPLEKIAQAALGLRAGDLNSRAPLAGLYEIKNLAITFNEMAETVQHSHSALEGLVEERTAELRRKNDELEAMIYIASHDLRSPLVNIQGFGANLEKYFGNVSNILENAQSLEEALAALRPTLTERIPKALQFVRTSSAKMDMLIKGLLSVSRVGSAVLQLESLDANRMIRDILDTMRFQLAEAKAVVVVEEPLANCRGDRGQVNQVFSNLLENAVKYRDPSRPLRIRVFSRVEGRNAIYVVEDTGLGIAAENCERVWELFRRVDSGYNTQGEGLGLTIVRRIVERHGGKVWMESELDVGSRFFVQLPS